MNILIVANHFLVSSARYATAAFERLGHTVRHIGPAMGRNIWGLTLPPEYVWERSIDVMSDYILNDVAPDLIIVMDSDPMTIDHNDANIIHEHEGTPIVVWGVDNHVRDYRRPYFDHYFLAHRKVSVMDWNEVCYGAKIDHSRGAPVILETITAHNADMTHIPCCYDPTLHTPSAIPFEEREYDVCMIGFMYPQRWTIVKALREAGFKVLAGCGLVYENYVQAYHNARISLCLSHNGDVAQRVFETAAMGNVVMTDNCPDYQILKPDGFWLLDNTNPQTVVEAVREVLSDPTQAQTMIERSRAWVDGQTWDERAAEIVRWYERTARA